MVEGQTIQFLCDSGADRTVLTKPPTDVQMSDDIMYIKAANGRVERHQVTRPFDLTDPETGRKTTATAAVVPSCPVNLLGRGEMGRLKISLVATDTGLKPVGEPVTAENYVIYDPTEPHYWWSLDFPDHDPSKTGQQLIDMLPKMPPETDFQLPGKMHVTLFYNYRPGPNYEYQKQFDELGPTRTTLSTIYYDLEGHAVCSASLPPPAKRLLRGWGANPHVSLCKPSAFLWQDMLQWLNTREDSEFWRPGEAGWDYNTKYKCWRKDLNWILTLTPHTHLDSKIAA